MQVRLSVMVILGSLWGLLCLNLLTLFMSVVFSTGTPFFPIEWQAPILFTSGGLLLIFRREIADKEGVAARVSALKIVAIHVPLYLAVLMAETFVASGGELAENGVSLFVYGLFYSVLLSPILIPLSIFSQTLMRQVARWAGGVHA
jgi:hypothetical protein